VTPIYLVILSLALAATLIFVAAWLYDRFVSHRGPPGREEQRSWSDGTIDRLVVAFPIAAGGLLLGLVISDSDIDLIDVCAEAMLLGAGVTATEGLLVRWRTPGHGRAAPTPLVLCIAAGAGLIGGIAAPSG
jgi:hypothetical protein